MGGRRIAFLMEQTLGGITHYLNLREQEASANGIVPVWLPIEFRAGRLPWAVTGSMIARRALSSVLDDVQGCFVHTTTIVLLAARYFGKKPAVLSSDGTPLNKRGMRIPYGLKPEGAVAEGVKRAIYRNVFRRAAGFVAWSDWAKSSLIQDYGCKDEDVVVIPPGVNVQNFAPGKRRNELPRILFVGGDFLRKGGDLLLEVFRKRLRGRAQLVLVTRAPLQSEPGVETYSDLAANSSQLRSLFAECDLFALPTRADVYSMVCLEALASGMPLVTTAVGGIPEIVKEGRTGHIVPVDDADALGDALEALITDARKRTEMGAAGRADAAERFDINRNSRRIFKFVSSRC